MPDGRAGKQRLIAAVKSTTAASAVKSTTAATAVRRHDRRQAVG
ncbi:MAG TPA: hypothetical protein VFB06_23395 [Streptosporangiaceae bacterium]|nr:hypothetical protein [Streptosporangiaceae bacterium]